MYRLFLFCLLFFYTSLVWSDDFYRTLNWNYPNRVLKLNDPSGLKFDGSLNLDRTGLPYWFESFELKSAAAEIVIKNAVFETVADSLIDPNWNIGNELQFKNEIGCSSGRSFLRLTINPFIRRTNHVEKLIGFTVSITENLNRLKSTTASYSWKSTSVLGSGKWVKIKTTNKGIYKITFDQLKLWGFANPDQVSLYGNGGYMLPVMNNDLRTDDLNAYPIWKGKDSSGKDCLFFYSTGSIQLKQDANTGIITHQQNYYSLETYFYLSDQGTVKTINKTAELSEVAGRKITSFPNYTFSEKELINLMMSGSRWFGERFTSGTAQTITLSLDNPDLSKPAQLVVSAVSRSSSSSNLNVSINGKLIGDISFQSVNISDAEANYADDRLVEFTEIFQTKAPQLKLTYTTPNSSSEAWLDYLSVNYQSLLAMSGDVYSFRGKGKEGSFSVSEFVVSGATASTKIFDVTDLNNTTEMPTTFADSQLKFKSNSIGIREYLAFNPGGTIPSPERVGELVNQNLHSADLVDMIIVSNPALLKSANELADLHKTKDLMTVQVVTPEEIYNEFSGGLPDPSGFRNYFRMCYDRGRKNGKNTLKYILFLGDGSYDNRNILGKGHDLLPTYQSDNSLSPTESFVSDDFFAFLDENEGGSDGTVDLGVGRIPARTLDEARVVVDKVLNYNLPEDMGNWRNLVTFIADDEDSNTHMTQAESMAGFVNNSYPPFLTEKIYFDAYKQLSTPGGEKYPDVNVAINSRVKQGALLMNYTGHANAKNLASENVMDIGSINSWTNSRLPVFVTATCEFSRFDADETSAGEQILFNPNGGGVGLFSTTRLVYSGANFELNKKFFNYIFEKDQLGNNFRLGDVMRLAKAAANTGTNQLNFSLFADPAIRLAYPNLKVITSSIDGKNVSAEVVLRPLSVVKVKGFIADSKGAKLSSFNGQIIPTVFDKAMQVETLGNAGENPFSYVVQNNIIYRGLASVKNGEFEFSFVVPKDVSFKSGIGKILYYAYNETVDAHGYCGNFNIGGLSETTIPDSKGPSIELFMNSDSFKDGEIVSASSVLLATISDETGINTSGTGIGHDITAVLDGDYSNILVLNDYFQTDLDKYSSGKIVFPFTNLAEGEHALKVKVWDVLNNSTEKEIRFVVKNSFRIESVKCYPNPMQEETRFEFTHNLFDETFDVTLEVFQSNGIRIDLLETTVGSQGTQSLPLVWTPSERLVKMMTGVYVYRLSVKTKDGKMSSNGSGRLLFIRR